MMQVRDNSNRLVEDHLGFARAMVRRLSSTLPGHADLEALESDAMFGLLRAARSFDPARGVAFTTYASKRIHGAMLDGLRERQGYGRNHRPPVIMSLSMPVGGDECHEGCLGDVLFNDDAPVGAVLERREQLDHLLRCVRTTERCMMREYYFGDLTQEQIGARHGISASRVSQRLKDARKRMQTAGREN